MEQKIFNFLLILLFAFSLLGLTFAAIWVIQSFSVFLYIIFCVIMGYLTSKFEDTLKDTILVNEVLIVIIMTITRISSFALSGGALWFLDSLNILASFIVYTIVMNLTSFIAWYVGEHK